MVGVEKKRRLCTALLIANLLFIWGNSLLPGSVSGAISGWLRDMLALLLPGGMPDGNTGHGLLRKLAHLAEFTCLGTLLSLRLMQSKKSAWWALPLGFLVAGGDEIIQCFVPGRGPGIVDVLIDTSGVLLGIGLLFAVHTVKNRKTETEDSRI